MPNTELIDSVVDPAVLKQFNDAQAASEALKAEFIQLAKAASVALAATGDAKSLKQLNSELAKTAILTEKLIQEQQKTVIANNNVTKSTIALQQAQDRQAASTQKQAQAAQKALSPYQQLSKELERQRLAAKDLAVQYGETSPQFLTAAKGVTELDGKLKGIDGTLGQSQRNVGNYGSAFSKLYGYIRTAANILPGVGISGIFLAGFEGIQYVVEQTGLLNLKLSQTALNQKALNDVNKEADEQAGKQITNLKYLYAAATDVNNSIGKRKLAVNELQREFPNYFKNISDETILNGGAQKSYDDLSASIISNARAMAAANKIAELRSKQLDADIQIQKIRNAEENEARKLAQDIKDGKFDVTTGTGEAGGSDILADQSAKKIHDRAVQAIKDQNDLKKGYQGTIDTIEKVAGGQTAIGNALAGEKDNTPKAKTGKTQAELLEEQLKALKLANDAIQADTTKSFDERYQSAYDFERKSEGLILDAESKKVLSITEASNKSAEVEKSANEDRKKIEAEATKAYQLELSSRLKALTDYEKQQILTVQNAQNERLISIDKEKTDYITGVTEQYVAGKISAEQYNQDLYNIEAATAQKRIEVQIAAAKKIIEIQALGLANGVGTPEDLQKSTNDLVKFEIEASNLVTKTDVDNKKKREAATKKLRDAELQLASEVANFVKTLIDGSFQTQIDNLKAQEKAVDDTSAKEKQAVDNSLDTQSNKARQIAIIDAQAQAQKEQLQQKERELQRKQAIADKAFSIASIIQNTAVAISKTLAEGGILFSPLVGVIAAIGAVQLATVLATPLPSYRIGTENHPGGLATVHAGELIETPTGGSYLTHTQQQVLDLPRGSKVRTAERTRAMIRPEVLSAYNGGASVTMLDTKPIVKAINDKPVPKQRREDWRNVDRRAAFGAYRDRRFK